ncbi:hypothetical protein RTG_00480 [Rhodotorula toruloides ATCC 204091]|uniref:Uncharacterized protein n=1 Tax=Rhodotorula toruloides TaxID=5286 RepID=A0A0K3C9Q8_RHOTO|nr:hypothetical protein RTG_00480 [Rhodotorula toruloides ATCC 204091]PRQ76823.1 hypothetical protein AAT19DRAFT_12241 [Rhodotorula toruloides]
MRRGMDGGREQSSDAASAQESVEASDEECGVEERPRSGGDGGSGELGFKTPQRGCERRAARAAASSCSSHTLAVSARAMPSSSQPVNLVSVNTAPERAKKVIGAVIEGVKDRYSIVHAGNSETIEGVKPLLESVQPPPGILVRELLLLLVGFQADAWTPEQQEEIQRIARETIPGIKTHAIPTGLQVQVGPDGIVKYLMERIDDIMKD